MHEVPESTSERDGRLKREAEKKLENLMQRGGKKRGDLQLARSEEQ